MSKDQLRVLIVGASIAGPATAYWFAKGGARVTVIERFPQMRTNGQNIDIRTVGVTVMRKMPGMEAAVRAKAVPLSGISFVNTHGRPFATIRATGNPDQQSLVSEFEILRGDLSQILFDMTSRDKNITYIFGEQVASIQQQSVLEDGPVTVTFTNGLLPTQDFDLIVAADGAASRTRALGLACRVREHMNPVNIWAAYFSIPHNLLPSNSKLGQAHNAPGGRFIALGPHSTPDTTQVTMMRTYPRHDTASMLPFREAQKRGDDTLKSFVADQFRGAGWKCDDIITAMMDDAQDFYASEIVQVKTPHLYNGRVVLVGDAGYAAGPTGGGTSLALTGAYVLAGEVCCRHKGDLGGALKGYEAVMRPVVGELQKIPWGLQEVMAPQTGWGLRVRNGVLWVVCCWAGVLGVVQRWFARAFGEREEGGLPEYEWVA
ncbi:oxidoreductase [Parachaetomium inaequale]|uniref:Oxidoreductase n=1 Tax=Parachaetomium inaequale TaxID=2588326 RepID=A0AAN6SPZ7_9PEZI|nr:oxidoreductase [Parachaetomium inaequale]